VAAGGGTVIYAGWKLAGSDGYGGGLVVLDRRRRNGVNATKPARFDALAVRLSGRCASRWQSLTMGAASATRSTSA
jgi:hypothetical protein